MIVFDWRRTYMFFPAQSPNFGRFLALPLLQLKCSGAILLRLKLLPKSPEGLFEDSLETLPGEVFLRDIFVEVTIGLEVD